MKLRYLTALVLALVSGVAWSVQSYLEADRDLRVDLRLQRADPSELARPPLPSTGDLSRPTAGLVVTEGRRNES